MQGKNYIFLLFILWLAACKPKQAGYESTFCLNLSSGTLESTDPAFAKDLYGMWTVHMLYNTLVEAGADLVIRPSVAKTWDISGDGKTYIFHLRTDVHFHDNEVFPGSKGRKMTAQDVVYSFNRITDPKTASPGAWIFNDRVRKEDPFVALDDSTVAIYLQSAFKPLPEILSMPYCSIVAREAVEKWQYDFRSRPCGTGPFQFKLWDEGNILQLEKNKAYWEKDSSGRALPYVDFVQISFIDNKATEFLQFLQGKLSFINGIDGSFKDLILNKRGELKPDFKDKFRLNKQTYLNTEYLGYLTDTSSPLVKGSPLRSKKLRQAINYGIDREKIVRYFRNGVGVPATGGFIPYGMIAHDSAHLYGYSYNPEKAAQLLKEAGYEKGKGLTPIAIVCPDNYADIVNFIATQLADIGIPVKIEIMQPNILKQQMSAGKVLFFRAQWIADYPDAETYLVFFNSHFPAPPNYTRFSNATFDSWYTKSLNAGDEERRILYKKMDSLAMSEAPIVPLFYDQLLHFTQNNIEGFESNPMNLIELKRVQIKSRN